MVTFLFSVYTITEAKHYAGLGRAEPGLESGRWIFHWCSAATVPTYDYKMKKNTNFTTA